MRQFINACLWILLIQVSFSSYSQYYSEDTLIPKRTNVRIGFSTRIGLGEIRTFNFPQEILKTDFYNQHFASAQEPDLTFTRWVVTIQPAVNAARIQYFYKNKLELEYGMDIGYQTATRTRDGLRKEITNADTSFTLAAINIDYKIRELYLGGYAILKTNNNYFDPYIGFGLSYYYGTTNATITNVLREQELNSYQLNMGSQGSLVTYIPFGIEFLLSQKEEKLFMKLMGSIRSETSKNQGVTTNRFLTLGAQIQYQF